MKIKTDDGENLPINLAAMCGNEKIVKMLFEKSQPYLAASMKCVAKIMEDGEIRMKEWKSRNEGTNESKTKADGSVFQFDESQIAPAINVEAEIEAEGLKNVGNEHFRKKNYAAALEAYTSAIQKQGDKASFWSNRSACYLAMKKYELALYDAEVGK